MTMQYDKRGLTCFLFSCMFGIDITTAESADSHAFVEVASQSGWRLQRWLDGWMVGWLDGWINALMIKDTSDGCILYT